MGMELLSMQMVIFIKDSFMRGKERVLGSTYSIMVMFTKENGLMISKMMNIAYFNLLPNQSMKEGSKTANFMVLEKWQNYNPETIIKDITSMEWNMEKAS